MATPFDDDEIAAIRATTPGCSDDLIHLDHAGSSLPDQTVLDVQVEHLQREAMMGGYAAAAEMAAATSAVYASTARLIGAEPSEIARFGSAAQAWSAAFWSVPMRPGQRIIIHDHEYGANAIAFIHAAKTRGVVIDRVGNDPNGQVSVDEVAQRLEHADDVAMVSLTHVPTNGGLVNPAAAVGRLTRAARVPYLVDACQSVGQLEVDVDAIGCDFLSMTGRKFIRGPRGIGFLYARTSILDHVTPAQPDHHAADWSSSDDYTFRAGARRFEFWEHSHANWLGLGAAVDVALGLGMDRVEATVTERATELREMLADIGMTVYDQGERRCGIVSAAIESVAASELQGQLRARGINSTITNIGSSRYDVERRNLPPMLRLSVHCTTTRDELVRAVRTLATLI